MACYFSMMILAVLNIIHQFTHPLLRIYCISHHVRSWSVSVRAHSTLKVVVKLFFSASYAFINFSNLFVLKRCFCSLGLWSSAASRTFPALSFQSYFGFAQFFISNCFALEFFCLLFFPLS